MAKCGVLFEVRTGFVNVVWMNFVLERVKVGNNVHKEERRDLFR
jgi:hypothetical protein